MVIVAGFFPLWPRAVESVSNGIGNITAWLTVPCQNGLDLRFGTCL